MMKPVPAGDAVAEIRKTEQQTQRRRQVIVTGGSSILLLILVAAVVATVYTSSEDKAEKAANGAGGIHTASKSVEMICTSTDYQQRCQKSLSKVVNPNDADPKDIIRAVVAVAFDEIGVAFNKTQNIKTNDSRIKGAMEDCRQLFVDSKDELREALAVIIEKGIDDLPDRAHDIQTWLSAVVSYQQTCIDGFPEGPLKAKLKGGMTKARELTSNALAIIGKAAKYMAMLNSDGLMRRRRLLAQEEEDRDGSPSWAPQRMLEEGSKIKLRPNVTVAKDGTAKFKSISAALAAMPKKRNGRYVIYVKPGEYRETVIVKSSMKDVTIYGDDPATTIITGKKSYADGTRIFQTATFAAVGEGFMAFGLTIRNTAGAKKQQAIALRVQSDRAIFVNCHIEGYRNTLYAQTHRQFYRGCTITGTVDFVFGDAAAVFQNCVMVVRRPLDNEAAVVTAQGRTDRHESTGFVLHRCKIVADKAMRPVIGKFKSYLGRPWKMHSRVVIMESEIGPLIRPEGYLAWRGEFGLKTLSYSEYKNYGPGSDVKKRVKWHGVKVISKAQAEDFTVSSFLNGWDWIKQRGMKVPVRMGLYDL